MPPLVAVLAAGSASRFGGGKLDADCAGKPVGAWVLEAATTAGLRPGVIVVGPQCPRFAARARGWRLLTNPEPQSGIAGSVSLGVAEAARQGRDLLLLLADMPLVGPGYLQKLVRAGGTSATRYEDGGLGVPALIGERDLPPFALLFGDRGAGGLLGELDGVQAFDPPSPGMLADIDTPDDLDTAAKALADWS